MKLFNKLFLCLGCWFFMSFPLHANDAVSLSELKKEFRELEKKLEKFEKQNEGEEQTPSKDMKLYATLRPTYGWIDDSGEEQFDVKDALSHAGFKSTTEFKKGWKAILHGEWGVDLSNNGDFGKARQVYVAVDSPYGRVGIGKQRPVQYLFIAEYIDIFNHGNSPFSYDPESLFFVNNLITYAKTISNFTLMAVAQFDGEQGDNFQDLFNTGVSYDKDNLHLALTYTKQDALADDAVIGEDEIVAVSGAYTLDSGLYLALGYQGKSYNRNTLMDRDGHTFDFSVAYPIAHQMKLKAGYFDFKDGVDGSESRDFNGVNLTTEWSPADNLRFHLEYLVRNFKEQKDYSSISVGFRYDFADTWHY